MLNVAEKPALPNNIYRDLMICELREFVGSSHRSLLSPFPETQDLFRRFLSTGRDPASWTSTYFTVALFRMINESGLKVQPLSVC